MRVKFWSVAFGKMFELQHKQSIYLPDNPDMDSARLEEMIRSRGAKYVYDHFLMDEDVYLMRKIRPHAPTQSYQELKVAAAELLDVHVKNVAIVGSAKTGYSLCPGKEYAPFNEDSDVDLIVVSEILFRSLWEKHLDYVNSSIGVAYKHIAKSVFRHFISVNSEKMPPEQLHHFVDWLPKVNQLRMTCQLKFGIAAEINYRVYDDWQYVERYHVNGLNKLVSTK